MMAVQKFREVKLSATKMGICTICGKRKTRTRTFSQTVNPWNKNTKGQPKTRNEIIDELDVERHLWRALPLVCAGCAAEDGK